MEQPFNQNEITSLYHSLLSCWNRRDATGMAALASPRCSFTGFDGSQMYGPQEIMASLQPIFANHPTAAYVSVIKEVRQLADGIALLRAAVGMVPPGKDDINPAVNAIQTLVAKRGEEGWMIELFQNTPAAFHGRPELAEQLSNELREAYRQHGVL